MANYKELVKCKLAFNDGRTLVKVELINNGKSIVYKFHNPMELEQYSGTFAGLHYLKIRIAIKNNNKEEVIKIYNESINQDALERTSVEEVLVEEHKKESLKNNDDVGHIGTGINISLDPSEITLRYLAEEEHLVKKIIDHEYDLSVRNLITKLVAKNKYVDVEETFKKSQIYSVDRVYDLTYEKLASLGMIDNTDRNNTSKIFKETNNMIDCVNETIEDERQANKAYENNWFYHNEEIQKQYDRAQCLKKAPIKKFFELQAQVKSLLKKYQSLYNKSKYDYTSKSKITQFLQKDLFYKNIDGSFLTYDINFKSNIQGDFHRYLFLLELYSIYFKEIEKLIKEYKIKYAHEVFYLDPNLIKKNCMKALSASQEVTEEQKKKDLARFKFDNENEEELFNDTLKSKVSQLETNITIKERKLKNSDFGKEEAGLAKQKALEDEIKELKDSLESQKNEIEEELKMQILNNRYYVRAYTYDSSVIYNYFRESVISIFQSMINEDIEKRKKIDYTLQIVPAVLGVISFIVLLYLFRDYNFKILKEINLRNNLTYVYLVIFFFSIISVIHLYRNRVQFKRIKRTRFQKRALIFYAICLVSFVGLRTYCINRYDGYNDYFYYVNIKNTETIRLDGMIVDVYRSGKITVPEKIDGKVIAEVSSKTFTRNSEGITKIEFETDKEIKFEKEVFSKFDVLNEVIINSQKFEVTEGMFANSEKFSKLTFTGEITSINDKGFYNCYNLLPFDFSNVDKIGDEAFYNCRLLKEIELKNDKLEYLGASAFEKCINLVSINFSNTKVKEIKESTFEGCGKMTTCLLPTTVTKVKENAYHSCEKLYEINFSNISEIGKSAFEDCNSLKKLEFSNELEKIGKQAFKNCLGVKEATVTMPKNYDSSYFRGLLDMCPNLTKLTFSSEKKVIDKELFKDYKNIKEIVFKTTVTEIEDEAFSGCTNLSKLTFINQVEEIGERAFDSCILLTDFTFAYNANKIANYAFENCIKMSEFEINSLEIDEISEGAFKDCIALNSVKLNNAIKTIEEGAFDGCESLKTINNLGSLKTIKENAFKDCKQLNNFYFAATVKSIENNSFKGCKGIQDITIEIDKSHNEGLYADALSILNNLKNVTLNVKENVIYEGLFKDLDTITNISVIGNVSKIENDAFNGCDSLSAIKINNEVKIIEKNAFKDCLALTDVAFAYNVSEIGESAFENCYSIKEFKFTNNELEVIEKNAFKSCKALNIVSLNQGIKEIEESGFAKCTSLTTVDNTSTLKKIGKNAFDGCIKIKEFVLSDSLTSLDETSFDRCEGINKLIINVSRKVSLKVYKTILRESDVLTTVIYNSSENNIPEELFKDIETLKNVVVQGAVTKVEEGAFENCINLESVAFAADVTKIEDNAFANCRKLTDFSFAYKVDSLGNNAFANCLSMNDFEFLSSKIGEINASSFSGCTNVIKVTLSNSIKLINDKAFLNCKNLVDVLNIDQIEVIGEKAFSGCVRLRSFDIGYNLKSIGDGAFKDCSSIKTLNISHAKGLDMESLDEIFDFSSLNHITYATEKGKIESKLFQNLYKLTKLEVISNIDEIGSYAFDGCLALSELTFINPVDEIGKYAFRDCRSLSDVSFAYEAEKIGKGAFKNCTKLSSFTISNNLTTIGNAIFDECINVTTLNINQSKELNIGKISDLFDGFCNVKTVYYSSESNELSNKLFYDLEDLTSITFNNQIDFIGDKAFKDCYNLANVKSTYNVKYVGKEAFMNCSKLIDISFASKAVQIEDGAFKNCSNIAMLNLNDATLTTIGNSAFENCNKIIFLSLPKTLKKIGDKAFKGCSLINEVVASSNLEEVGKKAFYDCSSLKQVVFEKNVEIGNKAFFGCKNVENIEVSLEGGLFGKRLTDIFKETDLTKVKKIRVYNVDKTRSVYFRDCINVESISIEGSVEKIGNNAFRELKRLTVVQLPNSIQVIGKSAFRDCSKLFIINYPTNLVEIRAYAFNGCRLITEKPTGNVVIDDSAFTNSGVRNK